MNNQRKIQSEDYLGGDRRKGNGRIKLSLRDWIWIIVTACSIFGTGVVGWVKLDNRVSANEVKAKEVKQVPIDIALLKNDVSHIKEDVADLKEDMKNGFKEIMDELKK